MSTRTWKIDDAHSTIHFSVSHMVIAKVHGRFLRWTAELAIDEADPTRSVASASIAAHSISTGNEQRDGHLRSPDFFDTEHFPTLEFRSREVERTGTDTFRVVGDLTIRGVTREIVIEARLGGFVDDPWGARRVGLTGRTSLQRSDYGLVWNQLIEGVGVVVGDRIDIGIEIEAIAQATAQAA